MVWMVVVVVAPLGWNLDYQYLNVRTCSRMVSFKKVELSLFLY